MSVLAELHYDAIGEGEMDLRACKDQFFPEAEKNKLTVLDTRPDAPKSTVPFVVKNVDGVNVGIISFGATLPEDTTNEYERRKTMFKAFMAARQASDVLVVLDQGNVVTADWLERNGKRLGMPDIVIPGIRRMGLQEPEIVGKTYIMPTSMQGKQLGTIDIEFAPGTDPKMTWTRVELGETVVEDEKIKGRISAFMNKGTAPGALAVAPPATGPQQVAVNTGPEKPYYSPSLCKSCHIKEYDDWSKTKHAAAIKTLVDGQRMIPECLVCHSEEYRRLKTVAIPSDNVGGVDCATCHIDALPHGLERKAVATRTRVSATGCLACHTKENSPKYDEQAYFPEIMHPSAVTSKPKALAGKAQ